MCLQKLDEGPNILGMWPAMHLQGDITPEGALITALVQCGAELHAKTASGPCFSRLGLVLEKHCPPLEKLAMDVPVPVAQA